MLADLVQAQALAPDPQLLERARRGDPAAFQELIRPLIPSVRRFAQAFARGWPDADDLAQEALVKAFRCFASFRGQCALSTWLYSVTRSVCHDERRSRQGRERRREDELDEQAAEERDSQATLLAQKRDVERLWAAIRALPAEFRAPLVLCDIEGLAYEEIARVEGIPIGTVRSRIARARARLLAALRDDPSFAPEGAGGTEPSRFSSNPEVTPA
jgi:RNA polymerase sigma-70 factor (ECF subfamily)